MQKINGIYYVPCKVNEIPMKFVFDTGASDVSISITEAKFLIKQGLISKNDIIGQVNYQIANGDIIEGTKIYLKKIEIGNTILKNIEATVLNEQFAPLLLGQSAISKLGTYTISGNLLKIKNLSLDSETLAADTIPNSKKYYIPKLSKINKLISDNGTIKTYFLKEKDIEGIWVKLVFQTKKKIKDKIITLKVYSRLEYYELKCKEKKIICSAIFYFDKNDNLEYACTDADTFYEYLDLSNQYIFEEYKEIYKFTCE